MSVHSLFPTLQAGWLLLVLVALSTAPALAQPATFDPSWYDASKSYVRIAVAEDGVYRLSGEALEAAGAPIGAIDPATLQLFENGREIPIHFDGGAAGSVEASDQILFVGRRNRGGDEAWAYKDQDLSLQSSAFRSLYTDTTYYWLTWGSTEGRRYQIVSAPSASEATTVLRDTLRQESDQLYHYGDPNDSDRPFYTRGEGYYWHEFSHGSTSPIDRTYTLPLERLDAGAGELHLRVRLNGKTGSRHRVTLEAELSGGGSTSFQEVDVADWNGYAFRTLRATLDPAEVPSGGELRVRVTSTNEFDAHPNAVLLDWIEADYERRLEAEENTQRFTVPEAGGGAFELSGYDDGTVLVFNARDGRRFEAEASGGAVTFSDDPSTGAVYWAVHEQALRPPATLSYRPAGTTESWATRSRGADYVLLAPKALMPSAEEMVAYRRTQDGYEVALAPLQEVFDQFDYGRPTPLAIRRFVHHTQAWATPPRFLALWGDATYPVRTETSQSDAPWNVPSFGFAPSDGWFAMQYDSDLSDRYSGAPGDEWKEVLAVGRIPIRTNEDGRTFLEKLQGHETAPLEDWQKRMLLLSGGTSFAQQNRLQVYSRTWGEDAAAPPTGMDTLYFAKQTDDALDNTFQDSLSAALRRGAGWLNYFGHSAAQTWEIVTDAPADFDNAGRLPFVVSLGCRTGSFAGGRHEAASAPAFGEQLVVGSPNGAIAHFGTSASGTIGASADLNDELTQRVFEDTVRVMGEAIQGAKAQIAESQHRSRLYVDHLLQYGLLGDPALRLALPEEPDLHLAPEQISYAPATPLPADSLTLSIRPRNRGLVPADSVDLELQHRLPDGSETYTYRLPPFALEHPIDARFLVTEEMAGTNTFRAILDPDDQIREANEANNTAEAEAVVSSSGVQFVYPRDRGIVREQRPTLRFTIAGLSDEEQTIEVELSEDPDFDGTPLDQAQLRLSDLLAEWEPSTTLEDDKTYYLRARVFDNENLADWHTGSFTVRTNLAGGGFLQQGPQFEANTQDPQFTRQSGSWRFAEYDIEVLASSETGAGGLKGQFSVGSQRYAYRTLGFGVLILDGLSGAVKANGSFCTYDVRDDILNERRCYDGLEGEEATGALEAFLDEHLEEGDYLFTRTRHLARAGSVTISDRVKALFRTLDETDTYSEAMDTLTYNDLWLMKARKGHPGETEELATDTTNEIAHRTRLPFRHAAGQTTTPLVGPARAWKELAWSAELSDDDELRIEVLSADGDSVLVDDLQEAASSQDLSHLSTRAHPYLRLRATLADSTERTAPQLRQWSITYDETAELALDGRQLEFTGDTLAVGEPLTASVPITNLSDTPADTVVMRFAVTDADNQSRTISTDTLFALSPGDVAPTEATLSTVDLAGSNILRIRAEQPGRPEPISFNNTLVRNFFVRTDREPPRFRVLIEGRELPHDPEPLQNLQDPGLPFVSARPTIEIEAEDEASHQPLADPDLVDVYLDCDPDDPTETCATATDTTFTPAEAPGEPARVVYTPDLSERDTTHTLRVFVRDAAGNQAGEGGQKASYQVHLRVQSELAVRDLYPYPNPMSTQTNFAFQLKGDDASKIEDFRIRVYTLSGRLIREFDLLENPFLLEAGGGLRIGWNKVPWDGTDVDGDRVATGIYLYKVFTRSSEGAIEVNNGRVEKIAVIR